MDLDDEIGINWLKDVIYDEDSDNFFILANKLQGRKGIYLVMVRQDEISKECQIEFLLRFSTDLEIGDCNVFISKDPALGIKEVLLSYKTIYLNTLSVMCIDIASKAMNLVFLHESFQLWGMKV